MTDEEKLSTMETAALYQSEYDALLRTRDDYKAQIVTLETQMTSKKASLDLLWKNFRRDIDSGL